MHKLIGVLLIAGSFTLGWILIDLQEYMRSPLPGIEQPVHYTVEPGASLIGVANDLRRRGIVEHPAYLVWYARWEGGADHIKAGDYILSPGLTPLRLLEQLGSGEVVQYSLTIPEGWTFRQLMAELGRQEKLKHELRGLEDEAIMALLGLPGQHPEGLFYPDTYKFSEGTPDIAILRQAHEAMTRRLEDEWRQRAPGLPYESPYEALIMASIIEKETALPEERQRIAGVFVRRLQKNMRLQTDPTVIYGMGEAFDGNIRRRDLKAPTPYNTYVIKGLPPTPIALPGGASIHAALHPAPGDELYFVARGDGSHQFSATIEEHNAAVRKYQLKR